MSNVYSQLLYFTGEFLALQMIIVEVFGASYILVRFFEIPFLDNRWSLSLT